MKKIIVYTMVVMLWLAMALPAGAQTLSAEKQALINKLDSGGSQTQKQMSETSVGSGEYQLDRLVAVF
ncbi:hypothetical protein N752_13520 [Desulforamulus aquiferis]|nr:hypothetical protein [Desulforamulus aquiferis]RYD04388.1 hypothetical protein N752_13520 [Desulforamulus aquiferis]